MHRGLTPSEPNLCSTLRHKNRRNVGYLRRRGEVRLGREWDALFRHAAETAKVASLCYGDAQIGMLSIEAVREKRGKGLCISQFRRTRTGS